MRASEKCRCHVIEIRFNYFLLGGETGGSGKANTVIRRGDEVPRCLGSPSISGPGRWWGHYNRIGHAGTTHGGGATIIYELQLPSTPAPQSRNKVTKEGGGIHCPHLVLSCHHHDHRPYQSFPLILPGFIHAHLATGDQLF